MQRLSWYYEKEWMSFVVNLSCVSLTVQVVVTESTSLVSHTPYAPLFKSLGHQIRVQGCVLGPALGLVAYLHAYAPPSISERNEAIARGFIFTI